MNNLVKEIISNHGTDVSGKWVAIDKVELIVKSVVIECADLCESFGESGDGFTCKYEILDHFGVE